ncbi:MAG: hypothetical protein WCF92_03165 [bacterium]
MQEFSPSDFEEAPEHEGEKWHLKRILEAIKEDNLWEIISTLHHAWISGFEDITQVPVNILETGYTTDKEIEIDSLENILEEYFEDKIKAGSFAVETRRELYKKILPYDIDLAYTLIKRIKDDDEDDGEQRYSTGTSYGTENPEELYETQVSHYHYIVDNDLGHYQLYEVLKNDGHFDDDAPYKLSKTLKRDIVKYAKEYIENNPKNQKNINFIKATQLRDFFTEKENS